MKRILKLFPVALAVLALASCSSDDLFGEKQGGFTTSEEGDLVVSVDPFDNTTRAFRDDEGNSLTFVEGDEFNVYDDELYKYDVYEYKAGNPKGAFFLKEDKILETPQYGLFPAKMVNRGYYDRASKLTKAEFELPHIITYDAESEMKSGDKVLYAANLPMFGIATLNGSKVNVSGLRHVCGVLKLTLSDVYGQATWLRLKSTEKVVSGTFVATLKSGEDRKSVKLEEGLSDLKTYNEMYIDLRNVPSRNSVLYIPLIPGIDANADGLALDYYNGDDVTEVSVLKEKTTADVDIVWTATGMKFPKDVIEANKLYECENAFGLDYMNPATITALLDQYKDTDAPINLEMTKKFEIDDTDAAIDEVVEIPALNDGVNVSISLAPSFTTWTVTSTTNGLTFEDADDEKPFTGKLTLNVGDKYNAVGGDAFDLVIDLPQADVEIIGDFTPSAAKDITVTAAKSVTFGDGKTETILGDGTGAFTLGEVKTLTVAAKSTVTYDIAETAGKTPIGIKVNVAGQIDGDLNFAKAYNAELKVTTTLGDVEAVAIDGDVDFGGDVEIALGDEGEAISGTLTMTGAKSELVWKQGYIDELEVALANVGTWEGQYIDVILDQPVKAATATAAAVYGKTSFLTLTETGHQEARFTKSVWGGAPITTTKYKDQVTDAYGVGRNFFTACQLAMTTSTGSDYQLANNIDLNGKAWTGIKKSGKFTGIKVAKVGVKDAANREYPTIENLNLVNGGGLFAEIDGDATISNVTIDGVTGAFTTDLAATAGTGAIAGVISAGDVTLNTVAVKGINIVSGSYPASAAPKTGIVPAVQIGGLIGYIKLGATLSTVKTTAAGTIQGYNQLGGFVGATEDDINIDKDSKAEVAVSSNYDSKKDQDLLYGKIGGFIGTITKDGDVTIAAGATATAPTHNFKTQEFMLDTTVENGDYYNFKDGAQTMIGYSGNKKLGTTYGIITIGGKVYIEPDFGKEKTIGTTEIGKAGTALANNRVLYWFDKKNK